MTPAIASVIIGIATIFTSGLVSSIVTYRLNRDKDQMLFMREKAESLYLAAHEFGLDLSKYVIPFFSVCKGDMDYNQMLDMQAANQSAKPNGGAEMMTMLVSIYFPEAEPQLQALLGARDRLGALRSRHSQAYKEGEGVGAFWLSEFKKAGREIDRAIKDMKAAIIVSARNYAGIRKPSKAPA